jgi:hypothetical protein
VEKWEQWMRLSITVKVVGVMRAASEKANLPMQEMVV